MSTTLRRCIRHLISEGIIDSLKKRYEGQDVDVDEIASRDPSPTKKYTPWMVKQIIVGANPNDLYPSIAYFDRHVAKFERKDINAYRTAKDLEDAVKDVDTKLGSAGGGETSAKIVTEDGSLTLEWLETKQDALRYSKSSKWCITQRSAGYFEQYVAANIVFYVIRDRSKDPKSMSDGFAYAISIQRNFDNEPIETEIWKQDDNTINAKSKKLSAAHRKLVNVAIKDSRSKPKSILAKLGDKEDVPDEEVERLLKVYEKPDEMKLIIEFLPQKFLERLATHESEIVREEVVRLIDPKYLQRMLNDENVQVRLRVVGRIDPSYLPEMMNDADEYIRSEIAKRIDPSHLPKMMDDKTPTVRVQVAKRIDHEHLLQMINDENADVRMQVAQRIDLERLPQMSRDKHRGIKELVAYRLKNERH